MNNNVTQADLFDQQQQHGGWGDWFSGFGDWFDWFGWGEQEQPTQLPILPAQQDPNISQMDLFDRNRPESWPGQNSQRPAAPMSPPVNASGTETQWGGPDIMPGQVATDGYYENPLPPPGQYSFLDAPGASDALVAFGAAMLKAPDFNTGLGDAALAVNRVARENRPIGEAEYERAKQLAMLERIKSGKSLPGQGGVDIDYSRTFKDKAGNVYFAGTKDGVSGMFNQNSGEFITGPIEGFTGRDTYDYGTIRGAQTAKDDAKFESEYTAMVGPIGQNISNFNRAIELARDPSAGVSSGMYERIGAQLSVLAPEWGPKLAAGIGAGNFDPNKVAEYDNIIVQAGLEYARQKFQGQGQVTEWERKLINEAMAIRGSQPREAAIKVLTILRDAEARKLEMLHNWKTNQVIDPNTGLRLKDKFANNFGDYVAWHTWQVYQQQIGGGGQSPQSSSGGRRMSLEEHFR